MAKRSRSKKWFIPVRGSYLPNSWQGALTYIPYVGYLIFTLIAGWHGTDSATKAVLFIAPNWIAATVVMTWIAKRTS